MSSSRQQLSQREIDAVLAHYRLGAVHDISELAAGSVYSPKVIVTSDRGRLLLKRRARGLDLPPLVAFSHEVLLACRRRGVCIPPLVGTKGENNSMTQFEDKVYELFVFIEGQGFNPHRDQHAHQSGALLAQVHAVMDTLRTRFEPAVEAATIDTSRLRALASRAATLPPGLGDSLTRLMGYGEELARSNAPRPALVHGDWHPGNMIFRGDQLVAICDFDNTRVGSRPREVAQAMVHTSLLPPEPGQTAARVAPEPGLDALVAFWRGYRGQQGACPARLCLGMMASVMIDEALAGVPDVHTAEGPDPSVPLLTAVQRKARWLDEHQQELLTLLES